MKNTLTISDFKPLMFEPEYNWQFQKPEPYKHYFFVFYNQVRKLPIRQDERIDYLKDTIRHALGLFKEIEKGVLLDDDSNGSHLPTWYNVINAFQKGLVM